MQIKILKVILKLIYEFSEQLQITLT